MESINVNQGVYSGQDQSLANQYMMPDFMNNFAGAGSFGGNNNITANGSGMPWQNQAMAGGIGGIGAALMQMLMGGSQQNPANAAMPYYSQINDTNKSILGPYANMGMGMGGMLGGQLSQLMSNPGAMMNSIGSNFHASPGYQFQVQQGLMGSNNAAAAGGMSGSPQNSQQNMSLASSLANQNYYQYLNNATNLYGQGLQGAQGMYGTGAEASNNMAGNISQGLSMQALAAYLGQANQNQNSNSMWGNLMGGIGDIASFIPGGSLFSGLSHLFSQGGS